MRVLIADDHSILRSGLKRILEEEFESIVVGEVSSCPELISTIEKTPWDVLILDIALGSQNSLNVLPAIKQTHRNLPVIILSMYSEPQFVIRALRAGASSYITKERAPDDLLRAIRAVLDGRRYISENIAEQIADHMALDDHENPHESLSPREYEILLLLASACSVSEIADRLHLSVKTISTYRSRILEKMGMNSNAELMRYAIERNLVKPVV